MNIYEKLQEARCRFQAADIKKTGRNKFSDYDYFELGDFMPAINSIMRELDMTSVTSFGIELATMTLINCEKPDERIEITSPMSKAALKACHEVQNLGAVETYIRRYLWQAALEIVEHDALDPVTAKPEDAATKQPPAKPADDPQATQNELKKLYDMAATKGYGKKSVDANSQSKFALPPEKLSRAQWMELYKVFHERSAKEKEVS